jgi:hypothetical protein
MVRQSTKDQGMSVSTSNLKAGQRSPLFSLAIDPFSTVKLWVVKPTDSLPSVKGPRHLFRRRFSSYQSMSNGRTIVLGRKG